MESSLAVATLGGPTTFAGQAAGVVASENPVLSVVSYFDSIPEGWAMLREGKVDRVLLVGETSRTGFTDIADYVLTHEEVVVTGSTMVAYNCCLIGLPGTELQQISEVRGHGSIHQCSDFLDRELPHARRNVHRQNSAAAGAEIAAGDGSIAVVGTKLLAQTLGLDVIDEGIDEGSRGAWWHIGAAATANRAEDQSWTDLLLRVHTATGVELLRVLTALTDRGLEPRSVHGLGCGEGSRRHYLISAAGPARHDSPAAVVDGLAVSVAGAYSSAEPWLPGEERPFQD